ncbi:hypothetical protein [Dactylosporangium sp. CA-233914]|uniref:hypothetical protein n=1 Tax=Dactylosporangium sp. CA-233914 TaxID=3239934 RepID=UPI003D8E2854
MDSRRNGPGAVQPPTAEQLEQLRKAARRGSRRSMLRLAKALYATGLSPHEVLAECFGVPFPDEFLEAVERRPPPGSFPHRAWVLAAPPESKSGAPGSFDEDKIRDRDPDLLPLVRLDDRHTEYGGLTLCYRMTELAAGRPVVYAIDADDPGDPVERCGESLLAVLLDYRDAAAGRRQPVTAPVAALRSRASRGDYRSMARLAWALYAAGRNPSQVLAECFGVPFPDEFFVLADAKPEDATLGYVTNLPWQLAVPPELGGPLRRPRPVMWPAERQIFGWDPDLVPLLALHGKFRMDHGAKEPPPPIRHGNLLHCYRLSELSAGRSTVFGVPWHSTRGIGELSVRACGPSLLTVLHEDATDRYDLDEWASVQPWNWGADTIDDTVLADSLQYVSEIEELRRRSPIADA